MTRLSRTLLIVDDSPEDREVYRRYLLRDPEYSYTILEANWGQQGLELWQQHQPDAVLLDHHLPDMDGLEFLHHLNPAVQKFCLPIVMMTGQSNEAIAVQAIKAGAQDYLIKGHLTAQELRLAVNGAVEAVQLHTQLHQRIERERLVAQIIRKIQQTLDLKEILQTTVEEVRQFLQTDRVLFFRLNPDGNGEVIAESVGTDWRSLLSVAIYDPCLAATTLDYRPEPFNPDSNCAGNSQPGDRQSWVTAISDIYNGSIKPCHVELLEQFQVKANLVVPILRDDQCWGLLIAHHCAAPRSWQPLETELLQELAPSVSIALRQAELYQQAQRELAERQQAEAELRESEERYATLAQIAPVGIFRTSLSGDNLYANTRWCELAGLSLEESKGKGWVNAIHPDDRDRVVTEWYQAVALNLPFSSEYRLQTPAGIASWVVGQAIAERDIEGRVIGYIGTITDITDRKQREEILRLQAQVLAQTHDSVITTDLTGCITTWNQGAERLFGYRAEEVLGQSVAMLYSPEMHAFLSQEVITPLKQKGEHEVEVTAQHKSGNQVDVLLSLSLLQDAQHQPIGMIGFSMDITKRKKAEKALRESEERFRQLAENIDAVFWLKEVTENRFSYISPAFGRLWGLQTAAVLDNPEVWLSYVHPDDRESVVQSFQQHAMTGQFDQEYRIIVADETVRWVRSRCFPLFDETGKIYRLAGISEDITERKQTNEALHNNEQQLRLALAGAKAGTWDWNIQTNEVTWSPENYDLYGVGTANAANWFRIWYNTIHPDDREQVRRELLHAIQRREIEFEIEFRIVHSQRGVRWLLGLGRFTLNEQGEPIRLSGINLDITDRKQTEETLRQSEAFKNRLLESSPDCIKVLDTEGRLLYINTGGLCLLEIDDISPYLNGEWASFWQGSDREAAEAAVATAGTGKSCQFQGFCCTAKGTPKWWDVVITPIMNTAGEVVQILVTSRDITARRQTEEALRESEERFRTLADNMSQFAWMADATGWIFWYNQRWFDYTGTNSAEMQGWGWQKVHHPDHVDRVTQHLRHCFETGQPWEDTFPLLGKDGQYRWFLSRAIPIRDQDGQIACWFGTNTDIDDRMQMEEALRQSEGLKEGILECSQDSIKVLGLNSEILYISTGGLRLLEIDDLDAILHTTWIDYWQGEDYEKAKAAIAAATQGHVGQFQGYRATIKGTPKWWDTIITPLRNAAGEVIQLVAISRDITANKQAELERDRLLAQEQMARAEAERANRIKDEFLAILSHELRSPLNPILGWTKLLQTRKFDAAKTAEALATIERNAKLQTQLIDDLLDVAKMLRGKLMIATAPVDLVFVIESAIDTVRAAAVAKSILLHPQLTSIGQVAGDAARLQQVVWNLLSNAIKFTPHQGRVDIRLDRVGNEAQITVSDTGKGINPDFLPHLFESFQQEDASTTRKYGGLGLGLAIVRSLVEAHGGTVVAESLGEGLGSTFIVRLPLLHTEIEVQQPNHFSRSDLDLAGMRILAVDDELDARELLTVLLTQYGAEVLTVTSATEVLAALESFQPDALVSDIGMPEIDGYSLIQQIRLLSPERGGKIPAIALTAYAREEDQKRAITSGFQRQVTKPLEPEQLVQALISLVPGRS